MSHRRQGGRPPVPPRQAAGQYRSLLIWFVLSNSQLCPEAALQPFGSSPPPPLSPTSPRKTLWLYGFLQHIPTSRSRRT
eukprot:gene8597-6035_t